MPKVHNISVDIMIIEEGEYFVAYCPALELTSYGTSQVEAKKSFADAVKIFIEETEKKGTLATVLLSLGWTLRQKPVTTYVPPITKSFIPPHLKASSVTHVRGIKGKIGIPSLA